MLTGAKACRGVGWVGWAGGGAVRGGRTGGGGGLYRTLYKIFTICIKMESCEGHCSVSLTAIISLGVK